MPIVLEDGTGVPGANSWASVADADAYYADRNIADWAGPGATEPAKEGFLIQAADYLSAHFRWRGDPVLIGQGLPVPTLEILDGNNASYVPVPVVQAQILLAREAATNGPLDTVLGQAQVSSERKQLQGVGETETHYVTAQSNVDQFGRVGSSVIAMLLPFTIAPGWIQQARVDLG